MTKLLTNFYKEYFPANPILKSIKLKCHYGFKLRQLIVISILFAVCPQKAMQYPTPDKQPKINILTTQPTLYRTPKTFK